MKKELLPMENAIESHLTVGDFTKAIDKARKHLDKPVDAIPIKIIFEAGSYDKHGEPWNELLLIQDIDDNCNGLFLILDPNFRDFKSLHGEHTDILKELNATAACALNMKRKKDYKSALELIAKTLKPIMMQKRNKKV